MNDWKDYEIRGLLHQEIQERFANQVETRIIDEMGILEGSFRIDVAVINGKLHGYEIKSPRDTLSRLSKQAEAYSAIFNTLTLVTSPSYVIDAASIVPEWWGISIAINTVGGFILDQARQPKSNPHVDSRAVIELLWRAEMLEILEKEGLSKGVRNKSPDLLATRLVENLSSDEIQKTVRKTLKSRANWRPDLD